MSRLSQWIATLFLVVNLAACATHQRTETVQYQDRRTGDPVAVERTTTDTTSTSEDSGVLSGTVNVVGEVIALPFRAVGGLLRALF
jgi:uncharacterized lipoprotein